MSNQENPLAFVELLTKMNTRPWRQLRGNFKVSPYRFVRVSIRMLSPLRGVDSGGINICRSFDRLKGKLNHARSSPNLGFSPFQDTPLARPGDRGLLDLPLECIEIVFGSL